MNARRSHVEPVADTSRLRAPRVADVALKPAWLANGGEMAGRIRSKDWSTSPLGSPATWPPHVGAAVGMCLSSLLPILLWLGPELCLIYNDASIPLLQISTVLGRF